MNLRVLATTSHDERPPCFGTLWDPREPDCLRCLCFSPCGQELKSAKVEPLAVAEIDASEEVAPQVHHNLGTNRTALTEAAMPPEPLLSVPEVAMPGDTPWSVFGRAMLRGIGKSVGWTVAEFFDRTPLGGLFRKK